MRATRLAAAWLLSLVLLLAAAYVVMPRLPSSTPPRVDDKAAMSLLHSEAMAFLVVRRTTTQVLIEHQEEDWCGQWRGVLWATVSWRWGIDLGKVSQDDIRCQGDTVVIRLPEPQLLDFAVQPASAGYISRATALPRLLDISRGGSQRQLLEAQLQQRAMDFAAREGLLPTRQEILQQVNGAAGMLEQAAGVKVRFE